MNKILYTLLFLLTFQWTTAQEIMVPETQQSIITKHTATWCPNCGTAAWDVFESLVNEVTSGAILLAAHRSRSSDLYAKVAEDFLVNMPGVVYQPEFFVNEEKFGGNYQTLADNIKAKVEENAEQAPLAQTGIQLLLNEDGSGPLRINTKTRFFQNAQGIYHLAIWLIEEEVEADQANRGTDAIHKQILKKALTEESFGIEIAVNNTDAGTEIENSFEYELAEGEDIENLEIAAIIWKKLGEKYEFVNGNSSTTFSTVSTTSTNLLESRLASFTVTPNLIDSEGMIELALNQRLENAQLNLYNVYGQLIQPIFSGNMDTGVNRFYLTASAVQSGGMYLVNLTTGEGTISRKVMIK
jgi:hypothetical protein